MSPQELHAYPQSRHRADLRYFPFQVASELGDLAAVLLYDVFSRTNGRRKPLRRAGRRWIYDAMGVFAAAHPYASESGVRKAFLSLENAGLLHIEKTGRYNRRRYDRKWWYALTENGARRARLRRIRFSPGVAAHLDLPKAVLLENFRHQLQQARAGDTGGYVSLDPATLQIPYSPRTIRRHLDALVIAGILERHPARKYRYRTAPMETPPPYVALTVSPHRLLPPLAPGQVGLLTAPSGTAKTSYSTFVATQMALAGYRVVSVTVEEPATNFVQRLHAQEYGVSYPGLHQGMDSVIGELHEKQIAGSARLRTIEANLKVIDLSGQYPTAQFILERVAGLSTLGFVPEVVFIDQLDFTSVGGAAEEGDGVAFGVAAPRAAALANAFRGQPFSTWVLHQVEGDPRPDFGPGDVAGEHEVTNCFHPVLGIGRTQRPDGSADIRVFSLTPTVEFERHFTAEYVHMRFKPRQGGRE